MSRECQLTGTKPAFGNSISHSHRRNRRRFDPNIQSHSYFVPSLGRRVTLQLSARSIRTVDKIGIEAAIARIIARGGKI